MTVTKFNPEKGGGKEPQLELFPVRQIEVASETEAGVIDKWHNKKDIQALVNPNIVAFLTVLLKENFDAGKPPGAAIAVMLQTYNDFIFADKENFRMLVEIHTTDATDLLKSK